jgi:hypothetical protein
MRKKSDLRLFAELDLKFDVVERGSMKNRNRKVREWNNDNFIMKKYGSSIRAKIAETLIPVHVAIYLNHKNNQEQKKILADIPKEKCGQS